jgi:hypothetical protein
MLQVLIFNEYPGHILTAIKELPYPFQEHISSVNNAQTTITLRSAYILPLHHVVFEGLSTTLPTEPASYFIKLTMYSLTKK